MKNKEKLRAEDSSTAEPAEILAGQVGRMYDLLPVGLIMSFLNSVIVCFVLRDAVPRTNVIVWFTAMMLLIVSRLVILIGNGKIRITPESAALWARRILVGLFLSGLVWGSSAFFLFPSSSMAYQVFIAFVLGGMAAGAAATFSQLKGGYPAFGVPALVPLVVRFFLIPGEFHLAMGIMVALFLAGLWWVALQNYRTYLTTLLLRLENRNVIGNLKEEKQKVEELNRALYAEIEARQKAEVELRLHHERLEATVEERTEELKKYRDRLEQIIEQKEILLRELYHRTKNNMQVISSLIGLQSASVSDERVLQMFRDTENRIMAMALVHEKLYKSSDLSSVNMKEYMTDLARALLESNARGGGNISLKLEADNIPLPIDVIMPCGLIINELMSNSLKYAFAGGRSGEIRISFHRTGEDLMELVYGDDGPGFQFTDFKNIKTLGLKLVNNLATKQLGGEVRMAAGGGAEFHIRFRTGLP